MSVLVMLEVNSLPNFYGGQMIGKSKKVRKRKKGLVSLKL